MAAGGKIKGYAIKRHLSPVRILKMAPYREERGIDMQNTYVLIKNYLIFLQVKIEPGASLLYTAFFLSHVSQTSNSPFIKSPWLESWLILDHVRWLLRTRCASVEEKSFYENNF